MLESGSREKVLMLATTAAMIEQFNKNNILILEEMGYEIHVAGNFQKGNPISDERLEKFKCWLSEHHGRWFHIPAVRKPTDSQNIKAYRQIVGLIREYQYEFIHCHTPIGSVIGRCAAIKTRTKVIYTAHGFHFFKGAPLKNWLLYYPVEWLCSWVTDVLITINKEDYARAKKHLHAKKIEYIPGVGIDLKKYHSGLVDKRKKRGELKVLENEFMLLSVGELIERKNHELVLYAISKLKKPEIRYYIAGTGEHEEYLRKVSKQLGIESQVVFLGFRNDVSELCQAADLFVFPSKQEGLPLALMEAIASKVPVVCSRIRGNIELVDDVCLFDLSCTNALAEKLNSILYSADANLTDRIEKSVSDNYNRLLQFDLKLIESDMKQIYEWGGVNLESVYFRNKICKEYGIPTDAFILISVGELNKNKNQEVVVNALRDLGNKQIFYLIVGKGELEEHYKLLLSRYHLERNVIILGYRTDVAQLFKSADCCIHPSLREGLGMAPLEAMASGLPLISANIGGLEDYTRDGISGYCISPKSVEDTKQAIAKMYVDKAFRRECGINNISISKGFDEILTNKVMRNIYKDIQGKRENDEK